MVITLEEICEWQGFDIMATALSVSSDYNYAFYAQRTDDSHCRQGDDSGVALLTRGTPYGNPYTFRYPLSNPQHQSDSDLNALNYRGGVGRVTLVLVGALAACGTHLSSNRDFALTKQLPDYGFGIASRYGSLHRWPGGDYNISYPNIPAFWSADYSDAFAYFPSYSFQLITGNPQALNEKIDYTGVDTDHSSVLAGDRDCQLEKSDHCVLIGRIGLYY